MQMNDITEVVIGAAIEVHRVLGPGLLESAYEQCMCRELQLRETPFRKQVDLPVEYKGMKLDCQYRVDLVVAERVAVGIKAVESLAPVHEARLLTYLKLGGWRVGLLINFNSAVRKDGLRRMILWVHPPLNLSSSPCLGVSVVPLSSRTIAITPSGPWW